MDAFDADVLIYAGIAGHRLGRRIVALFAANSRQSTGRPVGVGSALLLPELLSKPLRDEDTRTVAALGAFLYQLDLRPVDQAIAAEAAVLGAAYKLRAPVATHLATAISMGAQRFITNNSKDFGQPIKEIDITFPADLPDAAPGR